jgi:HD-like signal output (HDOD) protein
MAAETPALFVKFMSEIAFRLYLPRMSRAILKKFTEPDLAVGDIVSILEAYPYYRRFMTALTRETVKEGEKLTLDAAMLRFGMQKTRDHLCALQLMRVFKRVQKPVTENGKPAVPPAQVLKYALQAEEATLGKSPSHSEMAFAAGMLFDALEMIAVEKLDSSKIVIAYIEEIFKHGLLSAKIGVELARAVEGAPHPKHVFAACLVHDAGKAAMAMLAPEYTDFVTRCSGEGLGRPLRHAMERRRFALGHEVYSALCAQYFPLLSEVREAVLFHHEPYLAAGKRNDEMHVLASMVSLASNMANNFTLPKGNADPVYGKWYGKELAGVRLKRDRLPTIVAKLGRG